MSYSAEVVARQKIDRDVLTIVTQTVVSRDDPKLNDPTKPIGHHLTPEEARQLQSRGVAVGRDGNDNLRRMTTSPRPLDVVESDAVKQLVDEGKIVIAGGGGGPPVYQEEAGGCTATWFAHDWFA